MSLSSELRSINFGDHLCLIYEDENERLKVLILYIIDGLKNRERVFVLNENEVEIKEILKEILDLESIIDRQLFFLKSEELCSGSFDVTTLLQKLDNIEKKAIVDGFKGLRIVRNADPLHLKETLECEAKVNLLENTTILCLYNARRFDDEFLKRVVRLHPKIIWRGRVLDNFKFDVEDDGDLPSLMEKIVEMGELKKEFQRLEEQFRILFEGNDGIFILRGDTLVSCNSKALELFGAEKHEVIGKKIWHFSPRNQPNGLNSKKMAMEKINAALNGEPQVFEWRIISGDTPIDLEISLSRFTIDGRHHLMAIARDITERKKMEMALKESERRYRDLWENAGDILFIIDPKGNFLDANKTARDLFGYTKEEVRRLNIRDVVDERYHPIIYKEIEKILKSKKSKVTHVEVLCYTKDGRAIWIDSRAKPIIEHGSIKAIQGIARDITERKKMEMALKESEEKLHTIHSASPDAIIIADDSERITFWNVAATRMFGYEAEEVLGRGIFEVILGKKYHDPIKPKLLQFRSKSKKKNKVGTFYKTFETVGLKKDGVEFPIEISIGFIQLQGKWHTVAIIRDITKRKKFEKELKESAEKYKKIFQTSPNLIAILDENGIFLEANPAMIEILGINPVGESMHDVLPKDLARKGMEKIEYVIKNSKTISFEDSIGNRDFLYTLIPISFKGRKYCIIIARDITEIKRMSKLLKAVNEINKHLIREKDEFNLIKSASEELNSLGYFLSWIGIKKDNILITTSAIVRNLRLSEENVNCVTEALKDKSTVMREGKNTECEKCKFYDDHKNLVRYAIPMVADNNARGAFVIYSENRIADDEFEVLQTLANDLAFALNAIELEKAKLKAFEQIEKNIENYAILVDQIRNPLAIISGITEMKLDGKNGELRELREIIMEAVKRIEDVVSKLDMGWLESETIRDFLKEKPKNKFGLN